MKYYITTPIYYINDVPHIGHAYTTIAADVLARHHRAKGDEVFFLTGTDEHGAKIAEAAEKAGKEPQQFADELVPKFQDAWKNLNISYDEFFRTTDPKHEKIVQNFILMLKEKGFVEKQKYEGLYCVGCEKFLKESELVDGKCPDHKKEPVKQAEENYFFKLSEFGDKILAKIESGEFEIGPEARRNEVVGKIKQGLEDVSISRAGVKWGIPFPDDKEQTIYVWVDALLNYYSAMGIYAHTTPNPSSERRGTAIPPLAPPDSGGGIWPADLHLMAKDILWFHAVIWPAMLLAADLELPKKVFAHGFFTINNQKMSKTIGNVIDPNEVVAKYGADAVRYALLREFPFGEDGDISVEKIGSHYNSLANNIGNLLQRTISMINKYDVVIPAKAGILSDKIPDQVRDDKVVTIDAELEQLDFMGALKKIDDLAIVSNKDIADKQPWVLAKENKTQKLRAVLLQVFNNLDLIAELLLPFMPETSEKMKNQLESLEPVPLFPRLEEQSLFMRGENA
ncbi:methionine--tRNA ligase [Candidatus Berkelbacteria bacterium CG10_big_fil_rev_8_21_14_0_10_43_13]|uniref:methionine--tRNA ligase n=1 Tax=Candidatus Berkelbacteria bacterium CG10_big_fil_rev_8_21_14_0_10_43_13 TaxID=1974514 RepID=A0A2H0W796_9BACT|nr:MAG: methionine--tRNA ligase [Candidatus Berkelbacteria bacterium CG10_big_fil_rev_8_21_14_0_10_43_13]